MRQTVGGALWSGGWIGAAIAVAVAAGVGLSMFLAGHEFGEALLFALGLTLFLIPVCGCSLGAVLARKAYDVMYAPPGPPPAPPTDDEVLRQAAIDAAHPPIIAASVEDLWDRVRSCALLQIDLYYGQGKSPSRKLITREWDYGQADWNTARALLAEMQIIAGRQWAGLDYAQAARHIGRVRFETYENGGARLFVPRLDGNYSYLMFSTVARDNNYLESPAPLESEVYDG